MNNYQAEKQLVRDYYRELESSGADEAEAVLKHWCADDYYWRGFHPFNEQTGPNAVANTFWRPLKTALSSLQRRMDIFIAGENAIDDGKSTWVVSMGHLKGLYDEPWLGIRPNGKMCLLRYCEFNRIENGKIAETAMFFDIPHFMMQVGLRPFPSQTAAHLVQPGPATHDGLLFDESDPLEGAKTLDVINHMIDDLRVWQKDEPIEDELRRSWCEDMVWWGPAGIGATYTIERYAKQHASPFRNSFGEREFNGHVAKIAEGKYGGFFGWPNLRLKHSGGFMGMPATGIEGEMRVIDIYRREGDKLAENWIFIDMLHFWNQQGVDILERTVSHAEG